MGNFITILVLAILVISMLHHPSLTVMGKKVQRGGGYGYGYGYGSGSVKSFQCPSQCTRRCSRTQYHKPCMFFCQKCCRKCLCVPPGFYGNKAVCPCYNNWKTQQGGPKCP